MSVNFVLLGAAGYVAPKHFKAIKNVGGELIAAIDPHDSVGVLDSYFPNAAFFTEFERFDRYCEKYRSAIQYVVVATPNYLHDTHSRWALRKGFNVICEKPTCLTTKNLESLMKLEQETGRRVNTILQLRLHPSLKKIHDVVSFTQFDPVTSKYKVRIDYFTPRGKWYDFSWKGDIAKSGGLITNIGVHLVDVILWLFDWLIDDVSALELRCQTRDQRSISVNMFFGTCLDIEFTLSAATDVQPSRRFSVSLRDKPVMNGFATTETFGELHTASYEEIIAGRGFSTKDVVKTVALMERLRRLEFFSDNLPHYVL